MMATKNPYQGTDYDFFEAARDPETGEIKREMPKAAPSEKKVETLSTPTAKKAPIVTKEQLAKSGFTNLRDYLNAQRGLTRRDGKAPVMRDSVSTGRGTRAAGENVAPAKPAAKTAAPAAAPAKKAEPRKPLAKSEGFQRQIERDEAKREQRREFGRQRDAEKKASDKASLEALRNDPKQKELRTKREADSKMSPAERSAARGKKLKEFLGFAKGGSVSARADGIAKRGKTNCKII